MNLIDSLRLIAEPNLTAEQKDAVRGEVEKFFLAGGAVTMADWPRLSEDEKAILTEARARTMALQILAALEAPPIGDEVQSALERKMDGLEAGR